MVMTSAIQIDIFFQLNVLLVFILLLSITCFIFRYISIYYFIVKKSYFQVIINIIILLYYFKLLFSEFQTKGEFIKLFIKFYNDIIFV